MIKLISGDTKKCLQKIKADIKFPENGISPIEQIEWVEKNYNKDLTIITFSPYILNMFNLIIARENWTIDNISFDYITENGETLNLVCYDEKHGLLIDTEDFSLPISYIYNEYNKIRK